MFVSQLLLFVVIGYCFIPTSKWLLAWEIFSEGGMHSYSQSIIDQMDRNLADTVGSISPLNSNTWLLVCNSQNPIGTQATCLIQHYFFNFIYYYWLHPNALFSMIQRRGSQYYGSSASHILWKQHVSILVLQSICCWSLRTIKPDEAGCTIVELLTMFVEFAMSVCEQEGGKYKKLD
jgi:hypothetical protein